MRIGDKILDLLAEAYCGQIRDKPGMPHFGWFVDFFFAEGKFGSPPLYNEFGYSNCGSPSLWELLKERGMMLL